MLLESGWCACGGVLGVPQDSPATLMSESSLRNYQENFSRETHLLSA